MAKRHRDLLTRLEPIGLSRYNLTETDPQAVEKMRLRKLQRLDEQGAWFDDAYAFENDEGRVVFRYNLAWGRVGAACNVKIREAGTQLEKVETIIPPGDGLRWLPVEVIEAEEVESFLEALDKACAIPKPRSIAQSLAA